MNRKVSAVIPTYNRADKVGCAIESVLAQTYSACEVIVVDDGSTDGTRKVVEGYTDQAASCGVPIQYTYQPQQGVSAARNAGVLKATGEWVAFLDSDDRWLPHKLERQLQALSTFGRAYGACFTDARYVNNPDWKSTVFEQSDGPFQTPTGRIQDVPRFILRAMNGHGIFIQTLVVRRDLLYGLLDFDPHLRVYEDHDFVFRVGLHTSFCYVNESLVQIDRTSGRHEGLMELHAQQSFRLEQLTHMYQKWLAEETLPDAEIRGLLLAKVRSNRAAWASCHLVNGDYARAREAMAAALAYGFTMRNAAKWALVRWAPRTTRSIVRKRYERMVKAILPGF